MQAPGRCRWEAGCNSYPVPGACPAIAQVPLRAEASSVSCFPACYRLGGAGHRAKEGVYEGASSFGVVLALAVAGIAGGPSAAAGASTASPGADPGVGNVPQRTQSDAAYAQSV